jgi:NADPH:quinone reductase-like Zn-dependent oxidoreductase
MKAAVVPGPGRTPVYGDFDEPVPREDARVVHVAASALSNATRLRATGTHYSLAGRFPLVPGIDGVGRTDDGRRVGFFLPEPPFGGMAERTLVRDALLLPVPDALTDVLAAALINPGQSPITALRTRAGLRAGETVLINGATGITGQTAVQIAKHLGAGRVIVTGRDRDALTRLTELGADDTVDLTADPDDLRKALGTHVADGGVDVVLDYLSESPTAAVLAAIAAHHKATKPIRYVLTGSAAGTSVTIPTSILAATTVVLMGSGIGAVSIPDILTSATEALQIAAASELHIDVTEIPLSEVEKTWPQKSKTRIVYTP